jgi:hypothetical protein
MTQEEHAAKIRAAIDAAVADGLHVEITNSCCGCSLMALEIGPADADWSDSVTTMIMGEQE